MFSTFAQFLWKTHDVPGTVPSVGDTRINKVSTLPLWSLYFNGEQIDSKLKIWVKHVVGPMVMSAMEKNKAGEDKYVCSWVLWGSTKGDIWIDIWRRSENKNLTLSKNFQEEVLVIAKTLRWLRACHICWTVRRPGWLELSK